ncbi:MAG: hypothetical protein AAF614_40460 [Chloroflexota bacterium]
MKPKALYLILLLTALLLVACGGEEPAPAATEAPETTDEVIPENNEQAEADTSEEAETSISEEAETSTSVDATPTPTTSEDAPSEAPAYDGPVTEMAIRRLNAGQDVAAFASVRDAYVGVLKEQPNVGTDREFVAFVDFQTGAEPAPPVYIGMTQYPDFETFGTATGALADLPETADFFATFNPEVFAAMRPLNPADTYILVDILTEPGHILEVAARDLSQYENFDMANYEATRDEFLAALAQQPGFVEEYQWVSLLDPNVVVGMTVYESPEAYFALYGGDFGQAEITQAFSGQYPLVAGYANFDARAIAADNGVATLAFGEQVIAPETMAVHDGFGYTSNFFDGTISRINLETGETAVLVASGTDGAAAGWGLWYDDFTGELLACHARGEGENNAVWALNPDTGNILQTWELPAGALCNSLIAVENGDIYLTDVSPKADVVKIDRASGEAIVLLDDPSWENDTGFGLGGLVWDGGDNLYASGPGVLRIPISDPEAYTLQTIVDAEGNETFFSFDGAAFSAETGSFYGAAFDFEAFQSQIVKFTLLGEETLQAEVVFTGAIAATGVDAAGGNVYISDGQLIPSLFNPDYQPVTPYQMYIIVE